MRNPPNIPQPANRPDPGLEREVRTLLTVVDVLRARALNQPERIPITFIGDAGLPPEDVSYRALDTSARRIAALLLSLGLSRKPVLLAVVPGPHYSAAFWGCLYAGAIAVPVYPPFSPIVAKRLEGIAADCGAEVVLTDALIDGMRLDRAGPESRLARLRWLRIDELPEGSEAQWIHPRITDSELAFLQYTSGSTGAPKGVMVSHRNLLMNLISIIDTAVEYLRIDLSEDRQNVDRGLSWLPPYHDMGLTGMLSPIIGGGYLVLCSPTWFIRRPERWVREISARRIAISGGPNFAYEMLIQRAPLLQEQREPLDLSCWKVAINGAEPVRHDTIERFCEAFARWGFDPQTIMPSYGMAEATLYISAPRQRQPVVTVSLDRDAYAAGRVVETEDANAQVIVGCGRSHDRQTIAIVDPDTRVLSPPDRIGEIWVHGEHVAQGYWNRPELSEACFCATLVDAPAGMLKGPYLRTGDLGFLQNGTLFISGRIKDTIIIRGKKYHPADIERTAEAVSSDLSSASGAAFCVLEGDVERLVLAHEALRKPDITSLALQIKHAILRDHGIHLDELVLLARHGLPRTSSGKVQRQAVRQAYLDQALKVVASARL
jgi:acyl-CoA synthetase (AMP-forming)/AMP-acid ligase II